MRRLRIATVNCSLTPAMRAMGHEVVGLNLPPGVSYLPVELDRLGFTPDLLVQQENLGPRRILQGLESLDCPKVYWSIDTHLNSWWHCWYGRFFDLVFTTQEHWTARLKALGLGRVEWLPWYGREHPFRPHAGRDCPAGFVGRLSEQRRVRTWMAEFLRARLPFVLQQSVPSEDLPEAYSRIRLVPNEAILGELNFRVFEAASSGCAVFMPADKSGVGKLFALGEEIAVYGDALELAELLSFYLSRPELAERMGRAARARVLAEHLPGHRAARLLEAAEGIGASAKSGTRSDWTAMLLELSDSGMLSVDPRLLRSRLLEDSASPEGAARLVRFLSGLGDIRQLTGILAAALSERAFAGHTGFDLAGSMAGLGIGQFDLAKAFWYRRFDRAGAKGWTRPGSPEHLLVLWAGELGREGRVTRPGFPFDTARHLPQTALECLVRAMQIQGPDSGLDRPMSRMLMDMDGGDYLRLGVLSDLSLRNRNDWRLGLELGLLNLRCFRVEAGLEELEQSRLLAEEQGRGGSWRRVMAARDPQGRVSRLLGAPALSPQS